VLLLEPPGLLTSLLVGLVADEGMCFAEAAWGGMMVETWLWGVEEEETWRLVVGMMRSGTIETGCGK